MLRRLLLVALLALVAVPIAAQGPAGWKVLPDGGNATLSVMPTEKGFQLAGGPGIFFNPMNTVKPIYRVRATFTQLKAPAKNTYYGLFFGGNQMDTSPEYVYLAIAADGSFIIRHRAGTHVDEMDKSLHYAIKKPDANGQSTNTLEVRVSPDKIDYLVNGTVVTTTPKSGLTAKTDGIYGIRVNHLLEVHVDGFGVAKGT